MNRSGKNLFVNNMIKGTIHKEKTCYTLVWRQNCPIMVMVISNIEEAGEQGTLKNVTPERISQYPVQQNTHLKEQ